MHYSILGGPPRLGNQQFQDFAVETAHRYLIEQFPSLPGKNELIICEEGLDGTSSQSIVLLGDGLVELHPGLIEALREALIDFVMAVDWQLLSVRFDPPSDGTPRQTN